MADLGALVQQFKATSWSNLLSRGDHPLIIMDLFVEGITRRMAGVTGLGYNVKKYFRHSGKTFQNTQDCDELVIRTLKKMDEDPLWLSGRASDCLARGAKMVEFCNSLGKVDFTNADGPQLLQWFDKFCDKFADLSGYVYYPWTVEAAINSRLEPVVLEKLKAIGRENEVSECLSALSAPLALNEGGKEKVALLKLAVELSNTGLTAELREKIAQHSAKYRWVNSYALQFKPLTEVEVIQRIQAEKEPEKALAMLEVAEKKKWVELLELKEPYLRYVEDYTEWSFVRTRRMEHYTESLYLARPFFEEMAHRASLTFEQFVNLRPLELREFLTSGKLPSVEDLDERQKGYVLAYFGGLNYFFGVEAKQIVKLLEPASSGANSVKGMAVYKGKVTGKARIITSAYSKLNLQEGEILVATMTTPDQVILLEKAAAIVTDEGGLLCHAAIVARELQKPCVIGTKNATRVFKDGDLIEVDAESGVVRKVS